MKHTCERWNWKKKKRQNQKYPDLQNQEGTVNFRKMEVKR